MGRVPITARVEAPACAHDVLEPPLHPARVNISKCADRCDDAMPLPVCGAVICGKSSGSLRGVRAAGQGCDTAKLFLFLTPQTPAHAGGADITLLYNCCSCMLVVCWAPGGHTPRSTKQCQPVKIIIYKPSDQPGQPAHSSRCTHGWWSPVVVRGLNAMNGLLHAHPNPRQKPRHPPVT